MIQIKNRYNGDVIKEVKSLSNSNLSNSNLRSSDLRYSDLRYSNLTDSDLRNIDLRSSDLRYSDLRSSDLRYSDLSNIDLSITKLNYCVGNNKEVKSLQIGTYFVSYYKNILNIGCQTHALDEWIAFTDEVIDEMDKGTSLEWWKLNKDILITLVKREML